MEQMDKASIVADAINYVRELKQQVEVSHLVAMNEELSNGSLTGKLMSQAIALCLI